MSELLTAVQCCCPEQDEIIFSGLTWFEVEPLIEPQDFPNGFKAWGGSAPERFLALFDYDTIPEDFVFYGSCGQFWILKDPVCSVQIYIDGGGTYTPPPTGPQGTDPNRFGCGFSYPNNLIVAPYIGSPLPYEGQYEEVGNDKFKVTGLFIPTTPELYGNGNLLTRFWGETSYFRPGMDRLEPEFLDIEVEGLNNDEYAIRYTPVQKIWEATSGSFEDEPAGRTNNNPYADYWYNMKKYVVDRGVFEMQIEAGGGLVGTELNILELQEYSPSWNPDATLECCGATSSTPVNLCNYGGTGRWGSQAGSVEPDPQPGGVCGLDTDGPLAYGGVNLYLRGTQKVQIQGPATEFAVPKDGMGDFPRLLDPIYFKTGLTYFSKRPYPCEDNPGTPCYLSVWQSGPGGEASREWRVDPRRLLGVSGGFGPSDSVLAQFFYFLSGGQVQMGNPVFSKPEIVNAHSPIDGAALATIVWGAYNAAYPDQNIFGCGLSSGLWCTPPSSSLDPESCESDEPFDAFAWCGFPGFTTSQLSVTYAD